MTYDCQGFSLSIRSCMPVPGALPGGRADASALEIVEGPIAERGTGERYGLAADGAVLVDLSPAARFLCSTRRIVVETGRDVDRDWVAALLVANALPAVLWRLGSMVLHGCAFAPRSASAAVAICGPSGTGKSVALARMLDLGAAAVADDAIRVALRGDVLIGSGLPGAYRRRTGRDPSGRTLVEIPMAQRLSEAPLAGIFITIAGPDGAPPRFERIKGPAALQAVLGQRHRADALKAIQDEGTLLPLTARVAALPVYRWLRPKGHPVLMEGELEFLTRVARSGT